VDFAGIVIVALRGAGFECARLVASGGDIPDAALETVAGLRLDGALAVFGFRLRNRKLALRPRPGCWALSRRRRLRRPMAQRPLLANVFEHGYSYRLVPTAATAVACRLSSPSRTSEMGDRPHSQFYPGPACAIANSPASSSTCIPTRPGSHGCIWGLCPIPSRRQVCDCHSHRAFTCMTFAR